MPASGAAAAWAALPWYMYRKPTMARLQLSPFAADAGTRVRLEKGWDDRVASTPSNTPASSSRILPPPPFLRRRPDDYRPARQVLCAGLQAQGRAHCRHGDEIVPAAVPNLRQRVVLRQHGDGRTVASPTRDGRPERRLHPADSPLHPEVPVFQETPPARLEE